MGRDRDGVLAGRYRRLERIGQGGMGAVWRAYDTTLKREVAIRELRVPDRANEQQRRVWYARVARESRRAARLRHPGIVTVHDHVIGEDGRPWIVMEPISGISLERLSAGRQSLPEQRIAAIGVALVDALSAAHAHGLVHGGVKPSNVLLDGDRTVLTDFGIASIEDDMAFARPGTVPGTPAYTSPEQLAGQEATPASDLWSLGATLYAAVEGRPPFTAPTQAALFVVIATRQPAPPRCGGPLAQVLTGLLRQDPAERLPAAQVRALLTTATTERHPTSRAVAMDRKPADGPDLAASLHDIGARLRKAGRYADAVAVLEEAVAGRRALTATDPDRHLPDLAASLHELGINVADLDRHDDAVPLLEEAIALRRHLADADPGRHTSDLTRSLRELASTLETLDEQADAASVVQEAVARNRELVEAGSDHHLPDLAASLHALSITLRELDRHDEALAAQREVVAIHRALAETRPDRHQPALAVSLAELGDTLVKLGRHDDAPPVLEEAVALHRHLAEDDPGLYRPGLIMSLLTLSESLRQLGRGTEALTMSREAEAIRHQLHAAQEHR